MTISAASGNDCVEQRSDIASGGSCQYETVGLARGSPGGIAARFSMLLQDRQTEEHLKRSLSKLYVKQILGPSVPLTAFTPLLLLRVL